MTAGEIRGVLLDSFGRANEGEIDRIFPLIEEAMNNAYAQGQKEAERRLLRRHTQQLMEKDRAFEAALGIRHEKA